MEWIRKDRGVWGKCICCVFLLQQGVSSKVTLDVEVQVFQALESEMHIVVLHEVSAFEGALLIVSLIQRLCFP